MLSFGALSMLGVPPSLLSCHGSKDASLQEHYVKGLRGLYWDTGKENESIFSIALVVEPGKIIFF